MTVKHHIRGARVRGPFVQKGESLVDGALRSSHIQIGWLWRYPHGGLLESALFLDALGDMYGPGLVRATIVTRWGEMKECEHYLVWSGRLGWRQYEPWRAEEFSLLPYRELSLSLNKIAQIPPDLAIAYADDLSDTDGLVLALDIMAS